MNTHDPTPAMERLAAVRPGRCTEPDPQVTRAAERRTTAVLRRWGTAYERRRYTKEEARAAL